MDMHADEFDSPALSRIDAALASAEAAPIAEPRKGKAYGNDEHWKKLLRIINILRQKYYSWDQIRDFVAEHGFKYKGRASLYAMHRHLTKRFPQEGVGASDLRPKPEPAK